MSRASEKTQIMTIGQRGAIIGLVLSVPFAVTEFSGPLPLLWPPMALALASWVVPGLWRTIAFGAMGGVVAGVVILGVGFRLAMRVVAILDPIRSPEFTLGGTISILIFVGALGGGILGILGHLIRRAISLGPAMTAGVLSLGVLAMLFASPDLRTELFELGAGPGMNIPMFGSIAIVYAIAATTLTSRFEARATPRPVRHNLSGDASMTRPTKARAE